MQNHGRNRPDLAHGDLTSLAPHERLPEILVVPRVHARGEGERVLALESRPYFVWKVFPAFRAHLRMMLVSRGNSRRATWVVRGSLERHPEIPVFP